MKRSLTIVAVFICMSALLSVSVSAQKKKLKKMKWDTEFCEFEGTYDSSKYTEAQLRNTRDLMYSLNSSPLSTKIAVFKIEDLDKLDVKQLDDEYKREIEKLKNLDIIQDEYYQKMREKQLKVIEQFYKRSRLNVLGYKNPKILLEAENTGECREKYAEPLAVGGDSLLEAWKKLNLVMQSRNADPERVKKEFEFKLNSSDKFKYALVDMLTFGWSNCVNQTIDHASTDKPVQENFNRLFVKVKEIYCDKP